MHNVITKLKVNFIFIYAKYYSDQMFVHTTRQMLKCSTDNSKQNVFNKSF